MLKAGVRILASSSIKDLNIVKSLQSSRIYRRVELKMRRKVVRRRVVRSGLLLSNILMLVIILAFVLQSSNPKNTVTASVLAGTTNTPAVLNPVDQLSSANIALTVARLNSLPETTAINEQAQTQLADMAIASSDNNVLSKPQIVTTGLKSKADIKTYVVVAGDTIASLAAQFGVTSDSIRWSNPSVSSNLKAGTEISIPPVNGIVYTVKASDTVDSLTSRFRANRDLIVGYNDTEISGLKIGEKIIIPLSTQATSLSYFGYGFSWGGPTYGSNGYAPGYCTWYVASRINVPNNWGNAVSWAYFASQSGSGWKVSTKPTVGAIAQTTQLACYSRYGDRICLGHVAIVEAVSPDGSQIQYSDMNGVAGFNRVGYSKWTPASFFEKYISQ